MLPTRTFSGAGINRKPNQRTRSKVRLGSQFLRCRFSTRHSSNVGWGFVDESGLDAIFFEVGSLYVEFSIRIWELSFKGASGSDRVASSFGTATGSEKSSEKFWQRMPMMTGFSAVECFCRKVMTV